MNSESRFSPPSSEDYTREVREAWTDVIVNSWNDEKFLEKVRSDPKSAVEGRTIVDTSKGKYLPLPKERPSELQGLSEEELRQKLNEDGSRYFGPMMMGGAWADQNDGKAWTEVIIRAWTDEEFLNKLRSNPKEAIEALGNEEGYEEISNRIMASEGKYFPMTKERVPELEGLDDDELRRRLDRDEPGYFGWMMMCCL